MQIRAPMTSYPRPNFLLRPLKRGTQVGPHATHLLVQLINSIVVIVIKLLRPYCGTHLVEFYYKKPNISHTN